MIQLTGQFVPVKLNAEKEDGKPAAAKYGVRGFPTILFINGNGKVEGKIGGYLPPEGFAQQLTTISKAHRELPALAARIKANPNDAATAAELAIIYAGRGEVGGAEKMLAVAERRKAAAGGALSRAYNAVGDYYQENQKFDRAIALFEKGAKTARNPADKTYANISAAVCYLSMRKPKQAIPYLEAIAATPGAPKEYADQARQMLAAARAGGQ